MLERCLGQAAATREIIIIGAENSNVTYKHLLQDSNKMKKINVDIVYISTESGSQRTPLSQK